MAKKNKNKRTVSKTDKEDFFAKMYDNDSPYKAKVQKDRSKESKSTPSVSPGGVDITDDLIEDLEDYYEN